MYDTTIKLDDEIGKELNTFKKNSGAPIIYHIRKAIEEYLDKYRPLYGEAQSSNKQKSKSLKTKR